MDENGLQYVDYATFGDLAKRIQALEKRVTQLVDALQQVGTIAVSADGCVKRHISEINHY